MSSNSEFYPKLRNLEPVRIVVDGSEAIALKDPLQLQDRMLCVRREALPILALLDGNHSLRDIQAELTQRTGRIVFSDDIRAIVDQLDEACLLEGDRFREAFRVKVAEYRRRPFRPSSHAGISYHSDPQALRSELDSYFAGPSGPGLPEFNSDAARPVGLIAPHIDIRAGGACFAHAYHALAAGPPADVYVIFGTGHAGVEGMFSATTLDFETPFGRVETDRDLIDALGRAFGEDPAAEEILHATEHVIEFQIIFLQYLFAGRHRFTIVPVLCSLSHVIFSGDPLLNGRREHFDRFCSAMRDACRSRSVCFIASADLDHIGPRYGDPFVPHKGTVASSLQQDSELLSCLERLDVDGFIRGIARDDDARRVCGFSPIVTMLHCMEASRGRVLSLDFAHVDDRSSFVCFASMIFH
ncbi:MAG: AmmeMemoRadiSam system protein B [Desulfomonile sp.]|nr:AmmeMemoRadiSam system protein B [Desulfomonile sp.]